MDKYNKCEGCKLWNGHHCTGDRSYEPNGDKHKAICNEHMAKQFWIVYKQLQRNTVECEKYKQTLDEIEEMMKTCTNQDICTLCSYSNSCRNPDDFCSYDPDKVILNIITKAKGGK